MAPGPATKHSPLEQMKWEPKLGGRVHQQQLQGSGDCRGDAKHSQACELWKKDLLGMWRIKLHVKGYFVKE